MSVASQLPKGFLSDVLTAAGLVSHGKQCKALGERLGAAYMEIVGVTAAPAQPIVAALYVETDGAYFGLPGVDPWDINRDARLYPGPHPIVAHPPCQRWGRYATGAPNKPNTHKVGDDGGCFAAALGSIKKHGGVIEHPADSRAWPAHGLPKPPRKGGWIPTGDGGWTCCVYQGHYGHFAGKATWLVVYGIAEEDLPELIWGKTEQRIHPVALAKHGYAKARRIGMMAMVGGKDKTRIRNSTPAPFRKVLVELALLCRPANSIPSQGG